MIRPVIIGNCAWITAHSEEILPLSEQRAPLGRITPFSETIQQGGKKDFFLAQKVWLGGKVSDRNGYTVCKGASEHFRNSKCRKPGKTKSQSEQKAKRTNRIANFYRTPEPAVTQ